MAAASDVNVTPAKTTVSGDAAGFLKISSTDAVSFQVQAQAQTDDIANSAITTDKVADSAVTPAKILTTGDADGVLHYPTSGTIGSGLAIGQVQTADIADSAVTADKINDGAVTSDKFGDKTVTTAKLADSAVTSLKIGSSAVEINKISWNTKLDSYKPEGYSHGGVVVRYRNDSRLNYAEKLSGTIISDGTLPATALVSDLQTLISSIPAIVHGQSNSVTVSANSVAQVDVSFGSTLAEVPVVFASLQTASGTADVSITVQSVTNAQASFIVTNHTSADITDGTLDWLAVAGR